jgi:hypothetical protein
VGDKGTVINRVNCVKCGIELIVECERTAPGTSQSGAGFFQFDCPVCTGHNAAVRLTSPIKHIYAAARPREND